jgi:hypothetical protein
MQAQKIQMAPQGAGARGGPGNGTPALKAEEVVDIERTPEGVKLIRKIVLVDAKTGKYVRNLCLPCDEEWHEGLHGNDPNCVCEEDISVIDEITLPPDADVDEIL